MLAINDYDDDSHHGNVCGDDIGHQIPGVKLRYTKNSPTTEDNLRVSTGHLTKWRRRRYFLIQQIGGSSVNRIVSTELQ